MKKDISPFSPMRLGVQCVIVGALLGSPQLGLSQTTPNFGPNVTIFSPSMSSTTIQNKLVSLSNEAQFSNNRYAVLFMPGTYSVQSEVGFYESIAGLGLSPTAVTINGYLTSNQTDSNGNLTTNFWRSLENMTINSPTTLQWGVAQGAAFRRMNVNGPMELTNTNCGYASGGFISDSEITGTVNSCSQQQWYTRNSSIGSWSGSVWNMVFSGVQGAPAQSFPNPPYTVLATTPVSREKPFLYVDSSGNFNVFVPAFESNSSGTTWSSGSSLGSSLAIGSFYIAQPTNTAAQINSALASGKNLILTPGIYNLSGPINVTNANTVVLGLGYANLVPQAGTAAITIADVDGVKVAGLLIDAGPQNSPVLFEVGNSSGPGASHSSNPTSIGDVFFRIGGAANGLATTSLEVDSNNVILDNIWAWRADHGNAPVGWTINVAEHGLVVNGNNVTALGLAVEHYEQSQVIWNGNGGETIFYQSELPYDVPSQSAWMNGSVDGYPSYSVSPSVSTHKAYGLGVYSYFDQGVNIVENSAITVPVASGVTITDAVTVFLNGSGSITHVVNNTGATAQSGSGPIYLTSFGGAACTSNCASAPAAPTNLKATAASASGINLTWTASITSGVTYNVFRSTTSGFTPGSGSQIATGLSAASYSDTGLTASTTYYYVVEAVNSAGSSPASGQASATTQSSGSGGGGTDVLAINSGGAATGAFAADADFSGGGTATTTAAISTTGVTNPAPQAVYQSERNGAITYTLPGLKSGTSYTARLHFAEFYWTATGQRVFNVSINGTQVLTNFDIIAAAGGTDKAVVETFTATANSSGQIVIAFTSGKADQPKVSGIEVQSAAAPAETAINAGGAATGSFAADEDYSGGGTYSTSTTVSTSGVTNPAPVAVYQSARQGVVTYTIPGLTSGSSHTVRLHFAELYFSTAGSRVFNVAINGTTVLSNLDIVKTAGSNFKAVVEQFTATANSSGQVVISLTNGTADQPSINGIEVQ